MYVRSGKFGEFACCRTRRNVGAYHIIRTYILGIWSYVYRQSWVSGACGVWCVFSSDYYYYHYYYFLSSGGWGKIKLYLTTLPRIFIRVVCRSVAFAAKPLLLFYPKTSVHPVYVLILHPRETRRTNSVVTEPVRQSKPKPKPKQSQFIKVRKASELLTSGGTRTRQNNSDHKKRNAECGITILLRAFVGTLIVVIWWWYLCRL